MSSYIKAYLGATPLFTETTPVTSDSDWVRPTDWLTLSAAPADGFTGLCAVFNQTENYVCVRMITNDSSTYNIDWGDGTTQSAASNTLIIKNYDYNNAALDGTLTTRGYKQAIVTVTPQAGKTFTYCNISEKATTPAGLQSYSTGWLDLNINLPNLTSGQRLLIGSATVAPRFLERVNITSWGAVTIIGGLFIGCRNLQSINETEWNFANITRFDNIFNSCSMLTKFDGRYWDTRKVTLMNSTFQGCTYLKSIDTSTWVTSAVTQMDNMFNGCNSLINVDVSNFNTSKVTTMQNMFINCASLRSVNTTNWNTSLVTNMAGMFSGCSSLKTLVLSSFDTSKVTTMAQMFVNCYALETLNTTNWNLSACTSLSIFLNGCQNLRTIGPLDIPRVTTFGTSTCNNLVSAVFTNVRANFGFTTCNLGADALNTIYSGLSAVAPGTGLTVTVTSNYGTASDDPTIATAKNWTVTGS